MVYDLVGVDLLARAYLHVDERSLPEAVLIDRCRAVLDEQLVTAGMQYELLAYTVHKPGGGVQSESHALAVGDRVLQAQPERFCLADVLVLLILCQ